MTLAIDVEAAAGALAVRIALPPSAKTTVVIGPNGAGKTTLLKIVLGAVKATRGEIALGGHKLFSTRERVDVPVEERRLGYVPQHGALFPHMTVRENVGFGAGKSRTERDAIATALMDTLGIAHLADRKGASLSGGETRRVALARALAIRPRALLLDEPIAGLDAGAKDEVREVIAARLAALAIPTLVVTHDLDDARELGERIAVIEAGRLVQLGTLDELQENPATPFVERFLRGA